METGAEPAKKPAQVLNQRDAAAPSRDVISQLPSDRGHRLPHLLGRTASQRLVLSASDLFSNNRLIR